MLKSIDEILIEMKRHQYVADRALATIVYLARSRQKAAPLWCLLPIGPDSSMTP
jgi:hypothetical protein